MSKRGTISSSINLDVLVVFIVLAGLWATIAGSADPTAWIIGVPSVIAATWSYAILTTAVSGRVSVVAMARLLPTFLLESFRGGVDVARRVLGMRLNVEPGVFDYKIRLEATSARVLFIDLVSLLPGTLCADIDGDHMRIHSLDMRQDSEDELNRLEQRVGAVFGQHLPARKTQEK